MRIGCLLLMVVFLSAAASWAADDAETTSPDSGLSEDYSCMFCHGAEGTLAGDPAMKNLIVTEQDLAADIHWQTGLRCHDCHGGNPALEDYIDHRNDADFRPVESLTEIPHFCGHCHSDVEYMRRYNPSPRVDQVQEYWTSGHGQQLKKLADEYQQAVEKLDPTAEKPEIKAVGVATCLECHSHGEKHAILAVNDQKSSVYPTHVAETCAKCHSNTELMAGRTFRGKPLGYNQYELWSQSVHGQALLKRGDLSAPTCNDCHGNHGALPPDVGSVANACGTCHVKVAKLFAETAMKHRFEQLNLPGCATCHGNHQTLSPTDMMLGMEDQAVCVNCHKDQKYGATLAGANVARGLRSSLENLKQQLQVAEQTLEEAERLGMEVRGPRFDLLQARNALTNARSVIHSFAPGPVEKVVGEGLVVAEQVTASAQDALAEHTYRRLWLAGSMVPILIVVGLLLMYIRTLPAPEVPLPDESQVADTASTS